MGIESSPTAVISRELVARNDKPERELSRLRSRFPGLQEDVRVRKLFKDITTNLVHVIGLNHQRDPFFYQLGGFVNYQVEALVNPQPRAAGTPYGGVFYKAGEIEVITEE